MPWAFLVQSPFIASLLRSTWARRSTVLDDPFDKGDSGVPRSDFTGPISSRRRSTLTLLIPDSFELACSYQWAARWRRFVRDRPDSFSARSHQPSPRAVSSAPSEGLERSLEASALSAASAPLASFGS